MGMIHVKSLLKRLGYEIGIPLMVGVDKPPFQHAQLQPLRSVVSGGGYGSGTYEEEFENPPIAFASVPNAPSNITHVAVPWVSVTPPSGEGGGTNYDFSKYKYITLLPGYSSLDITEQNEKPFMYRILSGEELFLEESDNLQQYKLPHEEFYTNQTNHWSFNSGTFPYMFGKDYGGLYIHYPEVPYIGAATPMNTQATFWEGSSSYPETEPLFGHINDEGIHMSGPPILKKYMPPFLVREEQNRFVHSDLDEGMPTSAAPSSNYNIVHEDTDIPIAKKYSNGEKGYARLNVTESSYINNNPLLFVEGVEQTLTIKQPEPPDPNGDGSGNGDGSDDNSDYFDPTIDFYRYNYTQQGSVLWQYQPSIFVDRQNGWSCRWNVLVESGDKLYLEPIMGRLYQVFGDSFVSRIVNPYIGPYTEDLPSLPMAMRGPYGDGLGPSGDDSSDNSQEDPCEDPNDLYMCDTPREEEEEGGNNSDGNNIPDPDEEDNSSGGSTELTNWPEYVTGLAKISIQGLVQLALPLGNAEHWESFSEANVQRLSSVDYAKFESANLLDINVRAAFLGSNHGAGLIGAEYTPDNPTYYYSYVSNKEDAYDIGDNINWNELKGDPIFQEWVNGGVKRDRLYGREGSQTLKQRWSESPYGGYTESGYYITSGSAAQNLFLPAFNPVPDPNNSEATYDPLWYRDIKKALDSLFWWVIIDYLWWKNDGKRFDTSLIIAGLKEEYFNSYIPHKPYRVNNLMAQLILEEWFFNLRTSSGYDIQRAFYLNYQMVGGAALTDGYDAVGAANSFIDNWQQPQLVEKIKITVADSGVNEGEGL